MRKRVIAQLLTLPLTSSWLPSATPLVACVQDSAELPPGAGPGEDKALVFLKSKEESGKVVIHFRPSKWMDLLALRHKRDLAKSVIALEKKLGMTYDGKVHVLLYRDRHELSNLGRIRHGPTVYIHRNFVHAVFDQELQEHVAEVLIREWVPAWRKPRRTKRRLETSPSHAFLSAGLALALTREKIDSVFLRDWVAFYDRLESLPNLSTLESSYPHIGSEAPASWVAASWVRYLIDKYGLDKVKRFCATDDCRKIFGKSKSKLESGWSTWLHSSKVDLLTTALNGFEDAVVFKKELTGIKGKVILKVAGDDSFLLFHNGTFKKAGHTWYQPTRIFLDLKGKDSIEIVVINQGSAGGLLMELVDAKDKVRASSDKSWTARRAETKAKPVRVMGPPLSGRWREFLSDARKPPILAMRGSWIWDA